MSNETTPEHLETREKQPTPSIILLDGSKGAGKTTVGTILQERIKDIVFLTLDNERRSLSPSEENITERNKEAFEQLLQKGARYLDTGINLLIDCGLTNERIARIEALATEKGSSIHKFLLKASYETQLERVRNRDSAKGNPTDEARFAEVHDIIHAKEFNDFTVIDTDQLSPVEVAEKIILFITE